MENNIKLKYSIKDIVWFMLNNKPASAPIVNWNITGNFGSSLPIITYYVSHSQINQGMYERDLYNSKEELLKSL